MSDRLAVRPRKDQQSRRPAIHQFHPSAMYGDAVTKSLFMTQELLRGLGFESDILVAHGDPRLEGRLRDFRTHRSSANDVLLVHHSLGHDFGNWVLGLPDRKVLFYHNITPPEFFPDDPHLRTYAEIGRRQLVEFRPATIAAIADSPFNAEELRALGYEHVTVIPLLLDTERLHAAPWDATVVSANADRFTMLFVGRCARNKCQHDLIDLFRLVNRWLDRPAELVFIGYYSDELPYVHELQKRIAAYGLGDRVRFLGHVSDATLYGWYRSADVFVSMSEHEGFGVPLVEAMAFDVPVIAHESSNVPHTLDGAGVLFAGKPLEEVAALVCLLAEDRALRRTIVRRQRARHATFTQTAMRERLVALLTELGIAVPDVGAATRGSAATAPDMQIEGPFETSYSLAIVNRELALALDAQSPGDVALFATEGPGDYEPDRAAIHALPAVEGLWVRGQKGSRPRVVLRNLYPPRVADMDGLVNLLHFFWEESALPATWVDDFNRHLDAICAPSAFVRKILIDAGVHVPIRVIGSGIDHTCRTPRDSYPGEVGRRFRFLHVSSGFPRKAIDVLLEAYACTFTDRDDVSLVVKTFPNVHNETARQVADLRARHPSCPDVVLIEEDLPPGQLVDLYRQCHAFVAPSRGEGFGLPIAEAMLLGLPVVTTAFGGHRDFCREDTCLFVDYTFARSQSHMGLFDSVWVEPDAGQLARALRRVADAPPGALDTMRERAAAAVAEQCRWERSAARLRAVVDEVEAMEPLANRPLRLGMVSTWNSRCGVASYARYLLSSLPPAAFDCTIFACRGEETVEPDGPNVHRCWDGAGNPDLSDLTVQLARADLDAVLIQFNFSFYELRALGALIERLTADGIAVVVFFHSTRDVHDLSLRTIAPALGLADRLLVHGIADLNRLKSFGLVDNVTLFPQGVVEHRAGDAAGTRARLDLPGAGPVVASYGFLLPPKGIELLIEAFVAVRQTHPDARLLLVNALYPIPESTALRERCDALIERLGLADAVLLVDAFLEDAESLCLLECADLVVYPYQATAESSSAAVRFGLASGRPVACTPLEIFDDVADIVHRLPGSDATSIADGIINLLADPTLLASHTPRQQEWLRAHSWRVLGRRIAGMVRALVSDRAAPVEAAVSTPTPETSGGERCSRSTTLASVQMS
jgi:glycosyltransferase involved in cell wall biosynthesis